MSDDTHDPRTPSSKDGGVGPGRNALARVDAAERSLAFGEPAAGYIVPGVSAPPKRSVLDVLGRFKWTILLVAFLVAAPGVFAVWVFAVPKYKAWAVVRVRPIIPSLVFRTEESGPIPFYDSYLNTQVSVIRDPAVLERALGNKDVQDTRWYRDPPLSTMGAVHDRLRRVVALKTPMERLRDELEVSPRPRTELVDIVMTAPSAADARVIVNAVLDEYIKLVGETTDETRDLMYRKLANEYSSLENRIKAHEAEAEKLRRKLGTGSPEELVSQMRVRLDETEARLRQVRREIAIAKSKQADLQGLFKRAGEAATQPSSMPADDFLYENDPEWQRLRRDVELARFQLDLECARRLESHPSIDESKKRLALAEANLGEREAQLADRWNRNPSFRPAQAGPNHPMSADPYQVQSELRLLEQQEKLLAEEYKSQQENWRDAFNEVEGTV